MARLKDIRKRIASVKSTQQITKAMKMVAAAKLRRAEEAAVASRPYASKLEGMVRNLLQRVDASAHPLMKAPETQKRSLLLIVSSDRGLCGGYNANLLRQAEGFLAEREGEVTLEIVGRKAEESLRARGHSAAELHEMPTPQTSSELARELAKKVQDAYLAGEVDSVHVLYNAFQSTMTQVPTVEDLLPLQAPSDEGEGSDDNTDYLFEPDPGSIVGTLLPRLGQVRVLHALLEAGASEQAARMSAMDSATRNASEMIDRLTLEMNRARQAAITTELMEIISGAEALNG